MRRARDLTVVQSLDEELGRPRTRRDCAGGPRPCPWISCRHHLGVNVDPTTGALEAIGGRELRVANDVTDLDLDRFVDEVLERSSRVATCALDVADAKPGGLTLQEVGVLLDVTRERIRQIERKASTLLAPRVRRHLGRDVTRADTPPPRGSISVGDD